MSAEPRRERKVITVVFADIVGFTERAEQLDPEDVEAILGPYQALLRSELERLGGIVEKFIGDAVMAVFGAPLAHEDDPERAVRASLAVRDAIREGGRLEVRIAVHTGEAIVRLDARPSAGETLAAGDVLNTASRLQEAAPVNGVVVGEATYKATRHLVEYVPVAAVRAKGKAAPVAAWKAVRLSAGDVGLRPSSRTALVGRKRELTLLGETLERVESECAPQLVTLVGVPGIGKSRLVQELVRSRFQDDQHRCWRQGRCLPYGDGVSFWAVAEIVKAQAGIFESDDPEVVAAKLARAVREVVPDTEVERVESALSPLVGLEAAAGTGSERREDSFAAWRRFLEAIAERRPLMVVIEDLHWADEGVLDFLDYLADWATGVPLMVTCTSRPELLERRPGWGGGKLNALTLGLSPLGDDDAARLIASVLDQAALPAETQAALLERAGGNPLYAEQFALLFLERGSADLPLPENVHSLIAARLDTLAAEEKTLLQDAAVVGRLFWSGALPSDDRLADRLHALERKEFIRRERQSSVAGEDEYAFRHVLVRDVAYGQIPRADRARKHQLTAEWIESLGRPQDHAELLAHHYVAALELATASGADTTTLSSRARDALRDAGDRALSLNSFAAAKGFYSGALDLTAGDDPERPLLLFRFGEARFSNEEADDDVLVEAAEALREAGNMEAAAEAEVMLSHVAWTRGLQERAFEHLERATELIDGLLPSPAKTRVLSQRTRHFMLVSGDRGLRAVIRLSRGDLEGALEDTAKALDLARESDDPHVLWGALSVRAWMLSEAGESGKAATLLDEVLADHRTPASGRFYRGHPLALWVAHEAGRAGRLLEWMKQGGARRTRWLDAAEAFVSGDLVRAADLYGSGGHRPLEAFVRLRAARALAAEGRLADAEAQLAQALSYFRSVDAPHFASEGDSLLAALIAAS
jgi:class 3 adenylate cyclase/tetratricopeptide (TPR) repeat protein